MIYFKITFLSLIIAWKLLADFFHRLNAICFAHIFTRALFQTDRVLEFNKLSESRISTSFLDSIFISIQSGTYLYIHICMYVCLCEYLQTRNSCFLRVNTIHTYSMYLYVYHIYTAKALTFVVTCARAASIVHKDFSKKLLATWEFGGCLQLPTCCCWYVDDAVATFAAIGRGCILFFLFSTQSLFVFIFILNCVCFRVCELMYGIASLLTFYINWRFWMPRHCSLSYQFECIFHIIAFIIQYIRYYYFVDVKKNFKCSWTHLPTNTATWQ